jgi:hypothetical protein
MIANLVEGPKAHAEAGVLLQPSELVGVDAAAEV